VSIKSWVVEVIGQAAADERVQTAVENVLGKLITTRILPLVPVAAAAAAKAAVDEIVEKVPALEGVVDAVHVADKARNALNEIIPDVDLGIPALDELLDWWRPKP
jgi:hypothetical protein